MKDIYNDLSVVSTLRCDRRGTALEGTGVDLQGYIGALAVMNVAAIAGTDTPTATFVLEESVASASGFTAVAEGDILGGAGQFTAAAAGLVVRGYKGTKRYLRWSLTALGGTDPLASGTGEITRGLARHAPAGVAQVP